MAANSNPMKHQGSARLRAGQQPLTGRDVLQLVEAQREADMARERYMDDSQDSVWRRSINRTKAQKADQEVAAIRQRIAPGAAAPAAPAAPKPAAPAAPAQPVVSVDAIAADTPGGSTLPPPPVAAVDPASQISPEEEAARLRARLLLMGGNQRTGRLALTGGAQLGIRSLSGL